MHTLPIMGMENERRTNAGPSGFLNRQHPLLELPLLRTISPVPAVFGGERHRYAFALPHKLGTDPMAVDRMD